MYRIASLTQSVPLSVLCHVCQLFLREQRATDLTHSTYNLPIPQLRCIRFNAVFFCHIEYIFINVKHVTLRFKFSLNCAISTQHYT